MEDHVPEIAGLDSRKGLKMGEFHEDHNAEGELENTQANHIPPPLRETDTNTHTLYSRKVQRMRY